MPKLRRNPASLTQKFSAPEALLLERREMLSATSFDFGSDFHAPLAQSVRWIADDAEPPVAVGLGLRLDGEDANNIVYRLDDYFSDNIDKSLTFAVIMNTNPALFDAVYIDEREDASLLTLDVASDATGDAQITIRATDDAGNSVEDSLQLALLPVNDRPTTHGLWDVHVGSGDDRKTVIDLFAAFDDKEDADRQLTYSITQNTNPELFSAIQIDRDLGTLTFQYASQASGTSQITVRATDTEGLYVEMSTSGADFKIYNNL